MKSDYELFTTLHLSSPCIFCGSEIITYSQLQPSLKTSAGHQWWPSFVISSGSALLPCISKRLRFYMVKSGEECPATLHRSEALCLSGFQAVWWRVKSKIESSLFTRKTALAANHIPNHRWQFWRIFPPDVSFCAWQWHKVALSEGNILP